MATSSGKRGGDGDEEVAALEAKLGIPQASIQRQAISRLLVKLLAETSQQPDDSKDGGGSSIFSLLSASSTAPPQISASPYFKLLTRNGLAHPSPLVAEGAVNLVPKN